MTGGSLDHRVDPQVLNENGGEKAAILALDEAGRVSDDGFSLFLARSKFLLFVVVL